MARLRKLAGFALVTILVITLIADAAPLVLADNNGDEGSFDVLVFENGNWQLQGELSFSDYETLELTLDNDAGQVSIRLVQHGHDGAYVDYVALQKDLATYLPSGAIDVNANASILSKIISPEYDVCDAWNSALEIVWDGVPANATLVMRAMEEDLGAGHGGPIYYPDIRCGETLGYTLANDDGIIVDGVLEESEEPDFTVFWQPDSPHPDGYTYGWLHCDEDYLYAAVEVTADNTPDEEDWGALYVMVDGESREFRISCDDNQWGTSGFQYTSSVVYEHRTYEFQIPLSEIGACIGDEIRYGFGCYGTVTIDFDDVWVDDDWLGLKLDDPADGHTFGRDAFAAIQPAIGAVHVDGTVHVAAGIYHETVNINKSLALQGEGRDVVTVDAQGAYDAVFYVDADYVTISGFTITGADRGWGGYAGVYLLQASHCEISHNTITGNGDGIYLYDSHHNAITDNIVSDNWWEEISCPFVYSWNGQEYQFDSDVFSGAAVEALERTDYDELEYLTPENGQCRLKLTEELDETGYVNELKLIVADHPSGTEIIPDPQGNMHTLRAPYTAVAAEEDDGTECLDAVTDKDGVYWSSNLTNKDFDQEQDLTDGITLTFEKPTDAQTAKVALNYKFSELSELPGTTIFKLLGEKLDDWYDKLNSDPGELAKLRTFGIWLGRLHLAVWNGTNWVHAGVFDPPGPWIARDVIKTIDVSSIEGDIVSVRLVSTTGLVLIDSVRIDYSPDEDVITYELSATTAVDAHGIDVTPEILSDDDDYLTMEKGDYAQLSFDEVPPDTDYARSYVVKATGYYKSLVPAEGEAHEELVERLLTDLPFARRYFLEGYASDHGHSGIYLYLSSDNTISSNEIANNYGYYGEDGVGAYLSDDNRIADNDIYGNWFGIGAQICEGLHITGNNIHHNDYGIYVYDSHNIDILRNDIRENVTFDSGVHVSYDCTNVVVNCNNIVGNSLEWIGSHGVYNEGDGMVDARSNWWGCIEGPGAAGCDMVYGNVLYDPWLLDEFQNCRECVGAPTPPGVPTVSHIGIAAMIGLFAGLLVWSVRRRRLAS